MKQHRWIWLHRRVVWLAALPGDLCRGNSSGFSMFGASASNGRLGPADAGPRHDLGLTQTRSATGDAGSTPPPLEAECSEGGTRLDFSLAVIIQGE